MESDWSSKYLSPKRFQATDLTTRELVTTLIFWYTHVTGNPLPSNFVRLGGLIQFHPEILILYRSRLSLPVSPLPVWQPLCDTQSNVVRIGVKVYRAGADERLERPYSGGEFHPVIRGVQLTARDLLAIPIVQQDDAPSTDTRVWVAASIRVNSYEAQTISNFMAIDDSTARLCGYYSEEREVVNNLVPCEFEMASSNSRYIIDLTFTMRISIIVTIMD